MITYAAKKLGALSFYRPKWLEPPPYMVSAFETFHRTPWHSIQYLAENQ